VGPGRLASDNRPMRTKTRDTSEWIVNGRTRSRPWVIVLIVAAIAAVVVLAYQRFMAFDTVTYELRACATPVSPQSSWSDIEAAGCEPVSDDSVSVVVYEGTSRHEPSSVAGARYSFGDFPVNTTAHSVEVNGTDPMGTVLIVEPTNERIRREMAGNADGTAWTGFVGARGPTEYRILMSPEG
jgi:hypothetical protein